MKKVILSAILLFIISVLLITIPSKPSTTSGAPPYDGGIGDFVPDTEEESLLDGWKRPVGPAKVALQVGHWKTSEVPDELHRLRGNTGASGGGTTESEVNMAIAGETKVLLEKEGITVEILPATIPPHYWADVFVAIHADGSEDPEKSGYKLASPRRDATGNADNLLTEIENAYEKATGFEKDPNVTRNMRGYYAFSWRRYEHAVHPMTAAVILETGFLTSPSDRRLLVDNPSLPAEGLANGILSHLRTQKLL
jgi:hypothetical protein